MWLAIYIDPLSLTTKPMGLLIKLSTLMGMWEDDLTLLKHMVNK